MDIMQPQIGLDRLVTFLTRNQTSYFILLSFGISIKTSIIFGGLGPGPNELKETGIYTISLGLWW